MIAHANWPFRRQIRMSAVLLALLGCEVLLGQRATETRQEKVFPKLEYHKWSGKINVPDPVSVSVDDQGRVYASQTRRRKIQDLDIRQHREWVPDDVGFESVEDKRAFLKQKLAIGGDQATQRQHVQDLNGDGQHDWRDLQVVSEVIYRLTDENHDGTADAITVFAEDFKTEVTGIAAGVLAHDGSIWATIAPDVWKLTDREGDGQAEQREVMAHGFGLHIAYAGHDMHGLTVGPDGKIYWSIGDKGIHVTDQDGKLHAYPNQGGVMRCNPDGSDFEVFAHGLRNVQELAFDKYGNLFGVDNDSDQPGEKERFVYIVNGMDAGWRCNYQYRGEKYNPWVEESLWELAGENHPAYIVPPLSHYVDGPAGFVYNPGTALSPEYYDFFFLTSAPNGQQYAFRAEPHGDSFRMVDQHQIGSGIAIVGWNWGPDGGLYGADWDGGYPLDEKGSVVRVDAPGADSRIRAEVQELLNAGFNERSDEELVALLAHQDQRIRLHAQFELAKRGNEKGLRDTAVSTSAAVVTRLHAIWGLGQLARSGSQTAANTLVQLFDDSDIHVRGQAVKTYGELSMVDEHSVIPLLNDREEYVRTLAAIALARHPDAAAVTKLLDQLRELKEDQHYLRHSHTWALSQCASSEQLQASENRSRTELVRLSCVVALRQQKSPYVASYLEDPSNWIATEAARAIHDDFSIAAGMDRLAQALTQRREQTEAFSRRAINANFRDGSQQAAKRVAEFAADPSRAKAMRLEAIDALANWDGHAALDRVDGRNRKLPPRRIDSSSVSSALTELVGGDDSQLRTAALLASKRIGVTFADDLLVALVEDRELASELRSAALETLTSRKASVDLSELAISALQNGDSILKHQALRTLYLVDPDMGVAEAAKRIADQSESLSLRQNAIRSLINVPGADRLLRTLQRDLEQAELDESLALDLLETSRADERVTVASEIDLFSLARDGGDPERGELLFRNHGQAQCSRCHRIGRNGSNIGPELSQVGSKRDADYILRSIIDPSADIDANYRTQLFVLDSGQLLKGVLVSEDESKTVVADSEGNEVTIPSEEILQTKVQTVSLMPEMREVLSPTEVRDLVAYLRSLTGDNRK